MWCTKCGKYMLNIVCGCTCEVSLDGVWPQKILRYVVDTDDECLSVVMLSAVIDEYPRTQ